MEDCNMETHEGNIQCYGSSGMYNPFLLKGMREALERIVKAVNERKKIVIYGSNNLDGVTAVSLLLLVLKYLNADVEYFISDDSSHSFGIDSNIINNHIKFLGTKLIITVGCGIRAIEQVELCKQLGIDIIITDYHEPERIVPATTIINPLQKDCIYPFKSLAAVGIAYKLAQAISMYYRMKCINKYLDLVMLGTMTHNLPISGENKTIIDQGIYHLHYTNNYGFKALLKVHGLSDINKESINDLVFNLALALSSIRTAQNARIAVELFTTLNMDRAEQIAKYLNSAKKV